MLEVVQDKKREFRSSSLLRTGKQLYGVLSAMRWKWTNPFLVHFWGHV